MSLINLPFEEQSDPATVHFGQFLNRFHYLNAEERERIAAITSVLNLPKNHILQNIGYTCKTIYFMQSGVARIFYYKEDIDVTEQFALENQIIVRVESLFTGNPSRKGIQIIEDANILAIDAPALFALYDAYQGIERCFRKVFEAAHLDTVLRLESLQFHSAEERYEQLIRQTPDLIKRVPLKYIASYLGITQTSLSRIRAHH